MELLPAADRASARFELFERRLVDSGLCIDDVRSGVDAWPSDRVLGIEPLLEDPGEHGRKRHLQAGSAGCTDCERQARLVEGEAWCHAALEMISRLGLAEGNVRLAEEIVQLQVEARNPNPG